MEAPTLDIPQLPPSDRWPARLLPLLLIVAGCIFYSNALQAPFIFDDFDAIKNNAAIRSLSPIWKAAWSRQDSPVAGRPIPSLSLAIDYAIGGGVKSTAVFHVTNLVLHLLNGLLLFGVIRRVLLAWRRVQFDGSAAWFALAATSLWLLHPIQTEAVTYLTQRTELLVALFLLLTVYCMLRGAAVATGLTWYVGAIVACALGMASKEVMAAAPLMVFLIDGVFVAPSWGAALRRRWGLYVGLALTWGILAALLATAPRSMTVGLAHARIAPFEYLLTESGVILHYCWLLIAPAGLCIDYNDWPIARNIGDVAVPFASLVVASVVILVGVILRKPWGVLGACVLLVLGPSSSLVPILSEVVAERRMYLPVASFAIAVTALLWVLGGALVRSAAAQRGLAVVIFLAACGLGYLTYQRNVLYGDEVALWQDAVKKRPASDRAQHGLGSALFERGKLKPGPEGATLLEQARDALERALRINPGYENAHVGLGNVLMAQRRFSEAEPHLQAAVAANPNIPERQFYLGYCLSLQGRKGEALPHYRECARLDPGHYRARYMVGALSIELDHPAEAITPLREALKIPFDEPGVRLNCWRLLAQAYLNQRQNAEAIAVLREALTVFPGNAELSKALTDLGG